MQKSTAHCRYIQHKIKPFRCYKEFIGSIAILICVAGSGLQKENVKYVASIYYSVLELFYCLFYLLFCFAIKNGPCQLFLDLRICYTEHWVFIYILLQIWGLWIYFATRMNLLLFTGILNWKIIIFNWVKILFYSRNKNGGRKNKPSLSCTFICI